MKSLSFDKTNPISRLLGAALFGTALLISIDRVSAASALILSIPILVYTRFGPREWLSKAWPVLLGAVLAGISMTLYGRAEGQVYWSFLTATITDNSIRLGEAISLRVLAIGLPSIALLRNIDPTDLGDGLAQIMHLPSRFVLASVAGLRLVGLFRQDWYALGLARRARGVGESNRIKRNAGQALSLLVFALRRASTLSTAMEARAFGASPQRTWARTSTLSGVDWLLMAYCLFIAVGSLTLSVLSGELRLLGVA